MPVSENVYFDSHPNHGNRDQDRIGSIAAQGVVNFRGVEPVEQIKQCIGGHIRYLFLESIVVEQLERLTRLFDTVARVALNLVERRIQILPRKLTEH